MRRGVALAAVAVAFAAGCQHPQRGPRAGPERVQPHTSEPWPEHLSEWGLFRADDATLEPNPGVLPYDVATPLFSDYANKLRTVWMPEGTSAQYDAAQVFALPVGTILSKTFSFDARRIETRLLVHGERGWVALPYLWDADGTEATLEIVGAIVPVRSIHYVVPNANQCQGCHEQDKALVPIGLTARQLNRPGQLARWERLGAVTGLPPLEQVPQNALWGGGEGVERRARAYLDANCAHCHSPRGPAASAGLDLRSSTSEPRLLGVCKPPVAAGRGAGPGMLYDVVPGRPEASILPYRMRSTDPGVMMPELGRTVTHAEGAQLVEDWIRQLAGRCD